ncbi:GAF domain-containing protein [Motiliproteus coralliicola]|uniref:GAF domain-containing protein n=1 Tax=Motiliproteus coralliicola TaxID=2283196 RepID=A0A369WG41_9GAMM|nr:LuxR C-terminal-related transcriptional regulator [Motiliproteus coralliicola]RDE18435.1 GAF domain-containing protein [Motiliproteus coralliicola]
MSKKQRPDIPSPLLEKWQHIVDLLAQLTGTPATLITCVRKDEICLLVRSDQLDNPFQYTGFGKRCSDMYCDEVIRNQKPLLVEDATQSDDWKNAPKFEQGMTFYLGYPLIWPDSEPFGTICVMDRRSDNEAQKHHALIEEFQALINNDLMLLQELEDNRQRQRQLEYSLEEQNLELTSQSTDLDETHTALRVLLRQHEQDRKAIRLEANEELTRLVLPYLERIEQEALSTTQSNCLARLRHQLSSTADQQSIATTLLSPTEQKIVRFIQQDKSSKEIADLMHLAKSTIDFHRKNIRKKLGLKSGSINLKSYLTSRV